MGSEMCIRDSLQIAFYGMLRKAEVCAIGPHLLNFLPGLRAQSPSQSATFFQYH